MHVLPQPVLPATFRNDFVYPPGDSEASAPVGDAPHGVKVLISSDPVLKAAVSLVMIENAQSPQHENLELMQWRLAFQTWRSSQDREAYLQAGREGRIRMESNDSLSIDLAGN